MLVEMQCLPERIWHLQSSQPEGVKLDRVARPFQQHTTPEVCKCNLQPPLQALLAASSASSHRSTISQFL